jgi:hypothetical protein
MIFVSDASPLNYLVLIGADYVLPLLFGRVVCSSGVPEPQALQRRNSRRRGRLRLPPQKDAR